MPTSRKRQAPVTRPGHDRGMNVENGGRVSPRPHDDNNPRRGDSGQTRPDASAWEPATDDEIRRLYADGHTAAEVAARLGCSTSTIYYRLARAGVPRRPLGPPSRTHPGNAILHRLYVGEDQSLRQIAARYSVSRQTIRGWLRAAPIQRRTPGAPTPTWNRAEPIEMYLAGCTVPEIARRLKCSTTTVYRRLDTAAVPRRPTTTGIGRDELLKGLTDRLTAPEIAATCGVSVSCVCRALLRHGLQTARQTERQRHVQLYVSHVPTAVARQ